MSRVFFVNGEFVDEAEAKVSVLDRGFLFADAVYEVSSVLDGKLIDNQAHIVRLHRSLSELDMASSGVANLNSIPSPIMRPCQK
jgi:D-alanine transaminase